MRADPVWSIDVKAEQLAARRVHHGPLIAAARSSRLQVATHGLELADELAAQLGQRFLARQVTEVLAVAAHRERTDAHDVPLDGALALVFRSVLVVERRDGRAELDDLAGVRHFTNDLVPQTFELDDRRQCSRGRHTPQEIRTLLAFRRNPVLRAQHRLRQHRRGVTCNLARHAEQLAKVAFALPQQRRRFRDALLVLVPLPV